MCMRSGFLFMCEVPRPAQQQELAKLRVKNTRVKKVIKPCRKKLVGEWKE